MGTLEGGDGVSERARGEISLAKQLMRDEIQRLELGGSERLTNGVRRFAGMNEVGGQVAFSGSCSTARRIWSVDSSKRPRAPR